MIMENTEFLKYFINEDIYKIDEESVPSTSKPVVETHKAEHVEKPQQETPKVEEPQEAIAPSPVPVFKGGNKKGVLVLVEDAEAEFLNQKDLDYLLKILGAVKLSLDDIALVNASKETGYSRISFQQALVFTTNHSLPLGSNQKYSQIPFEGNQVLLADRLDQIAASVELRKALWDALRLLFQA